MRTYSYELSYKSAKNQNRPKTKWPNIKKCSPQISPTFVIVTHGCWQWWYYLPVRHEWQRFKLKTLRYQKVSLHKSETNSIIQVIIACAAHNFDYQDKEFHKTIKGKLTSHLTRMAKCTESKELFMFQFDLPTWNAWPEWNKTIEWPSLLKMPSSQEYQLKLNLNIFATWVFLSRTHRPPELMK